MTRERALWVADSVHHPTLYKDELEEALQVLAAWVREILVGIGPIVDPEMMKLVGWSDKREKS